MLKDIDEQGRTRNLRDIDHCSEFDRKWRGITAEERSAIDAEIERPGRPITVRHALLRTAQSDVRLLAKVTRPLAIQCPTHSPSHRLRRGRCLTLRANRYRRAKRPKTDFASAASV